MQPRIIEVNIICKQSFLDNENNGIDIFQNKINFISIAPSYQLHITKSFGLVIKEGITYIKLNIDGAKILALISKGKTFIDILDELKINSEILENFIRKLFSYGILIFTIKAKPIPLSGSISSYYPIHCSIEITNECFLSCKHCYANANKGKKQELNISQVLKIFDELQNKTRIITITGGDPLCHKDIKEILLTSKKYGFVTRLNTSGYLIDEEFVRFLKLIQIDGVKISLDGSTPQIHNYLRNNSIAFENAIKCMKLLKKYKINFSIGTVIGDFNLHDVDNIVSLGISMGATKIGIGTILALGRAKTNNNLLISKQENLLKEIDNVLRKYQDKVVFEEDGNWTRFIASSTLFNKESYLNYKTNINCLSCDGCGAGFKIQFIDSKLNIRPCMMSEIIIGNVDGELKYNEKKLNIINNLKSPSNEQCLDCNQLSSCLGCIAKGFLNGRKEKNCSWINDNFKYIKQLNEVEK